MPALKYRDPVTGNWIALAGPAGPAGPGVPAGGTPGQMLSKESVTDYDTGWATPPASTSDSYRFVQPTPSSTWTIDHNLPFRPNVSIVDSFGREIVAEIAYSSQTQVVLSFSPACAGEAYLS